MVVEEIGKKRGVKLEIMIFGFCFYGELEKNKHSESGDSHVRLLPSKFLACGAFWR